MIEDSVQPWKAPSAADLAAAEAVVNAPSVIGMFAACEWDELHEDGQLWLAAIVRQARESIDTRKHEEVSVTRPAAASAAPGKGAFLAMEQWDQRDETVLLLIDYRENGEHPIDDADVAITIGHNNDHNVGEGEGQGWQIAGWCWTHDHYTEGKGRPLGWMPLPHNVARTVLSLQAGEGAA